MAGLKDSSGDFIELINFFVTKQILKSSDQVRFLVAITASEILDNFGSNSQSMVQILQYTCYEGIESMINSIQPIITKCCPSSEENDIDQLRGLFLEQLKQESRKKLSQSFTDQFNDSPVDPFTQNMRQFYDQFAKKLEILDPLDRPILDETGADQAIKCKQLRKRVENMAAMRGCDIVLTLND